MLLNHLPLKPGTELTSPGGRRLEISDIFVPRNDVLKGRQLPPSFRQLGRKIVVFRDGSMVPLTEVKQRFRMPLTTVDTSAA